MKTMFRQTKGLSGLIIGLIVMMVSSCAPQTKLKVQMAAEVETTGIKKVAVGNFEIAEVNRVFRQERNGKWKTKKVNMTSAQKEALSKQIRARVINLLATTPSFKLVYTDQFSALKSDAAMQELIGVTGYKTNLVDAVINGKVWLDVVNNDGVELEKTSLKYAQGGNPNGYNYTMETLVFWPYKSISGTMSLEIKLTKLNPTEVIATVVDTRKYSHKVGGKAASLIGQVTSGVTAVGSALAAKEDKNKIESSDKVLPNFEQLVADMAESIAARFVQKVSITQKRVSYSVAPGGDETARMLIKAGAYDMAVKRLDKVIAEAKNPADVYNRALCYEATGEYELAASEYKEALKADNLNLIYAQGVGRIERARRESRKVREQLSDK